MNIIVVGCGKVGVRLANSLCYLGHDVAVVDRNSETFHNLGESFTGITVAGIPFDQDILRQAGISECDALAAVTQDDNLNIVISQVAHEVFNVPKVITRILDPTRETVFEKIGLKTVCPTKLTASAVVNSITHDNNDQLVNFGINTVSFVVRSDKHWTGKRLADIPLHENESIFAIVDVFGRFTLASNLNRMIEENDKIAFSILID